ncbi:Copper transport protein CTR2 [Ceratocystis platani]|uniref:Copper transport protein n=1 Tax=Ceratocystis fimbriata f. sp. platani TaxID=88771 RepID=A0A0F8CWP3_CERFI|nr:Copper transport protein CTR2 [Ceratocystis platani]
MDHSHMGHSHMDHSHMDHGDAPGDNMPMCSMNMLFTWDTNNLCIVFRQWRITSSLSLAISLLTIVAIAAGYEAFRSALRGYEAAVAKRIETAPRQTQEQVTKRAHLIKAVMYGVQSFYAFMLMLVFMTYNGWVMLAVSVGAFVGYLMFAENAPLANEGVCH